MVVGNKGHTRAFYLCLPRHIAFTHFLSTVLSKVVMVYLRGQALKEYNTMKIVNDIEDLKALSEKYTSPCAKCDTAEGCPAPVNCKVYNDWKKKLHEEMGRSVLQYNKLAESAGNDQEA